MSWFTELRTRVPACWLYRLRVVVAKDPEDWMRPGSLGKQSGSTTELEPGVSIADALERIDGFRSDVAGVQERFAGARSEIDTAALLHTVDLVFAEPGTSYSGDGVNPVVESAHAVPLMNEPYYVPPRKIIGTDWLPAAASGALVINDRGEVLLQQRRDDRSWGTPGGYVDIGERIVAAAVRELREETGLTGTARRLLAIRSGPDCTVVYPHGDKGWFVSFLHLVEVSGGQLLKSTDETVDADWFSPDDLPAAMGAYNRWCAELARDLPQHVVVD